MHLYESQNNLISFHELKLRSYSLRGIAYHHAGLTFKDRQLVENGFRNGQIPILLCTNTLAMGVNFPAHMVIVKSTEVNYSFHPLNQIFFKFT